MNKDCGYIVDCLNKGELPDLNRLTKNGLNTIIYTIDGKVKHK